ncbi:MULTISPECIES: LPS export ABC transporter periplasmic protein LptC [Donghicola]|jgi:lipopolysaccharide export system protein LptC|uniref:Putative lipopolysaccharide export system protein LptC n=1 Tax=Donghicola eburneus TaxID=393278 RepID=A0A1M4N380_9RHOB|nr:MULTISPECIES: LPS export ABC transporter periplasmic protein LptC [Donghicola]MCT4576621.1 LPS export ABC transporter periplasmic protein LptC [Donghicola sp.]SCM69269.1 putative lipopolysaccharide export system protein LptC [Donghicola eburneus]SFQ44739.1 lipopolysaccharide export system protein LptC [Donghicola eburneus]
MAGSQRNTYSVIVSWAKIILPMVALGLLSTVFLFSRQIDPEAAIPFADIDLEERLREQRLSKPNYATTTEDGSALTIVAESAAPVLDGDGGTAENIVARLKRIDGTTIDMTSDSGRIEGTKTLTLSGNVAIDTSDGYTLRSDEMISAMNRTDITSPGPITGTGPFGDLQAGRMHLTVPENQDGILAVFEDGVRLIYTGNSKGSEEQQ